MPAAAMKEMMANSSPEEQKKGMEEWREWMADNAAHFADEGAAAGKNTRVTATNVEEISNDVGGYSIMQGESKEEVIEVLKKSPHVNMPGTYSEVMELIQM